jgi:hypothetical protein
LNLVHERHLELPSLRYYNSLGSGISGIVPAFLPRPRSEQQVAWTADFAIRVFSVAITATVPYSIAVSKLRRPFLSGFFIAVRVLRRRESNSRA